MLVAAQDEMPEVELELDVGLNQVIEDDMVSALHGNDQELLHEMADRHMQAMEIIRKSQERAAEAARLAAEQLAAEQAYEQNWGAPDYDAVFDSDADYSNNDVYDF
jgi:hypothetical protein